MKKVIYILILSALAFACGSPGAFAQERTITKYMPEGDTYFKYTGTAADTLVSTNQDTIDFILYYRADGYVAKTAVKIRWDLRSKADTTVNVTFAGAEFGDHTTYTDINAAAAGADINANNTVYTLVSDPYITEAAATFGADSITAAHNHTPFDKSYRKYRLRMIITGASGAGTGVKIDELEFKFYTY